MKAIVLISGGLDSAVMLAQAIKDGKECFGLSFDYGQRHRLELRSAQALCRHYNIPHRLIKLDASIFGTSTLLSAIKVPKDRKPEEIATQGIPSTYVPARNTIFLAYALGHAELVQAEEIYYGPNALDFHLYPDCRSAFVSAFQEVANTATAQAVNGHPPKIMAPLIHMNKQEIIKRGEELNVPFKLTLSCYDPTPLGYHCSACDACSLRKDGFATAGVQDAALFN